MKKALILGKHHVSTKTENNNNSKKKKSEKFEAL